MVPHLFNSTFDYLLIVVQGRNSRVDVDRNVHSSSIPSLCSSAGGNTKGYSIPAWHFFALKTNMIYSR